MQTIVASLNRAARQCSVSVPSSWITARQQDQIELRDDFLLETVDDIQDRLDLPSPIAGSVTLTGGTGVTNADGSQRFSLPSDFKRLQRDQLAVYDKLQDRAVVPISSDGEWAHLTDLGAAGAVKYYRTAGYEGAYTIDVYAATSTGEIIVSYITDNWMAASGGAVGGAFTDPDDLLILPRRLVEAGMVWRFRERRGLPYDDKYNEYEAMLARLANDARSRRVIDMGSGGSSVRWQDRVPAFIPGS